ncbi:hypothetical protein GCK72_008550 [Caenorhabditis remanei]|uniref:F-box domain-containing protein n=1 Tax=Caenorhabditis remanei TaxID=31234 RepID=A0A6A5H0Z0_CAERE|nr:hypothetical protein GCK72_008550 [Caenorhabditis remanei]KAF1760303.1 hypothetical protein GCK72_008550 [Caenorhabditis remanei]
MEPTFPILKLPKNVIVHVLEGIDFTQLLIFSLVSSKTKQLVTSLGIEARDIDIGINRKISINVHSTKSYSSLNFYDDSNDQNELSLVDINIPVAATFQYQYTRIQTSAPLLSFNNWLNHIRTIFSYTKPLNVYFCQGCERFEVQSLKNALGNINTLFLTVPTDDSSRKILKCFDSSSELFLNRNPFEDTCQIQQILISNCEILRFVDEYSLDDMLLINSEKVKFYRSATQKQFNQFLKHWIRGSNPRLRRMSLLITGLVDGEVYLKGIRCMRMSKAAKREIRRKHNLSDFLHMIQIKRNDGTAAVVASEKSVDMHYVRFIVLH